MLEQRLLVLGHYQQIVSPIEWKFTRRDVERPLARLDKTGEPAVELRAA